MPTIDLHTPIAAPVGRCFDLARSIDFHVFTSEHTRERPVAGRTSGLIGPGETVTWRARHFGIWQQLTVEVTIFDPPQHFQDIMVSGAFSWMRHDHRFEPRGAGAVMHDEFAFRSPLGVIGRLADDLFLVGYMRRFLMERARALKAAAESDSWRRFLVS